MAGHGCIGCSDPRRNASDVDIIRARRIALTLYNSDSLKFILTHVHDQNLPILLRKITITRDMSHSSRLVNRLRKIAEHLRDVGGKWDVHPSDHNTHELDKDRLYAFADEFETMAENFESRASWYSRYASSPIIGLMYLISRAEGY
jgi:hypothetical protein